MMVKFQASHAGVPPETGASIHSQPVLSRSFAENARPLSTLTVKKSTGHE